MSEERVQSLKQRFMSAYDATADGKLQIQEVARHCFRLKRYIDTQGDKWIDALVRRSMLIKLIFYSLHQLKIT